MSLSGNKSAKADALRDNAEARARIHGDAVARAGAGGDSVPVLYDSSGNVIADPSPMEFEERDGGKSTVEGGAA